MAAKASPKRPQGGGSGAGPGARAKREAAGPGARAKREAAGPGARAKREAAGPGARAKREAAAAKAKREAAGRGGGPSAGRRRAAAPPGGAGGRDPARGAVESALLRMAGTTKSLFAEVKAVSDSTRAVAREVKAVAREVKAVAREVKAVSDSTRVASREARAMAGIFAENQKILVSMRSMMDALTSATEQIQGQFSRVAVLEKDAQKLYAGLNYAKAQSAAVSRMGDQAARLQERMEKIEKDKGLADAGSIARKVSDSVDAARNNAVMITRIGRRLDEVGKEVKAVAGKTDSALAAGPGIDALGSRLEEIRAGAESSREAGEREAESLRDQMRALAERMQPVSAVSSQVAGLSAEVARLQAMAGEAAGGAGALGAAMDGVRSEVREAAARAEVLAGMAGKLQAMESEVAALAKRADATAFAGEGLKAVESDIAEMKRDMLSSSASVRDRVSSLAAAAERSGAAAAESRARAEGAFAEIRALREDAAASSDGSSREMMALLRLAGYQSGIRMRAESKYGGIGELRGMVEQTAEIAALFGRLSADSAGRMPMPREVSQWAVSKILDCADRWEVRFSEVYGLLKDGLGRDALREAAGARQVREIYGSRAAEEMRADLETGDAAAGGRDPGRAPA